MGRSVRSFLLLSFLLFNFRIFASEEVTGIWKTINDRKGFVTSIIVVYKSDDKIYGRVIAAFDEKTGDLIDTLYAPQQHIDQNEKYPFLCRSNLFWNLFWDGSVWTGGRVIDPRNGKIFHCQLWADDGILILRGFFGIFGLNQIFYPVEEDDYPSGFIIPDYMKFVPMIPVLID